MHVTEREILILDTVNAKGFISFKDLESIVEGSPATIRRDLERLSSQGKLKRVHGGIQSLERGTKPLLSTRLHLSGSSFDENIGINMRQKQAIGRAAASMCTRGEGIMIDGGSTTFQMCAHLDDLHLQVLTNSLHIVLTLVEQPNTRVLMPGGTVFREQNIVLPLFGEDLIPQFHAPKLFMGAGVVGPQGLMQEDVVLVAGERRFIERANEIIVLVDSSKFIEPSGHVVCGLDQISTLITDDGIDDRSAQFIERAGTKLVVVPYDT